MISKHLDEIIRQHNRTTNVQIVFVDVESYSKRRTLTQLDVIDSLTELLTNALNAIAKEYIDYAQKNNINFSNDIIKIPTGDGAAIAFCFDGLHDIHLSFARNLLRLLNEPKLEESCVFFETDGWCNCHSYLNLRIGISEGKAIVFKDLNDNYNVAGKVINLASRVMGLADRNQIMFTEDGYNQIVDMIEDSSFVQQFRPYLEVDIKHGEKINIYQYIEDLPYLNFGEPEDLSFIRRARESMRKLSVIGFPMFGEAFEKLDKASMLGIMETMGNMADKLAGFGQGSVRELPPRGVGISPEVKESRDG